MRAVIILFAMFFALPASAQDDAHYLNGTFSVQGISLLPTMTINRVIASDGNFYKIALTAKPGVKDFVKKVKITKSEIELSGGNKKPATQFNVLLSPEYFLGVTKLMSDYSSTKFEFKCTKVPKNPDTCTIEFLRISE